MKDYAPTYLQPFQYFALSFTSILLFVITLIFEEQIFRPPFTTVLYNESYPDFSLMSYVSSLVVFQISIFLYAFTLFYQVGNQAL